MTRSIISKILIALIALFTIQSVFWFFKTSAIKKHTLAVIAASNGKVSAASVTVAGFPLSQKLKIEDLKFDLTSMPGGTKIPNKYQIIVKHFEADAGIFANDFTINAIKDVSFQDIDNHVSYVDFKRSPQASFSIVSGQLVKFSYQDGGYKVLDAGKNVLFENGNSSVVFEAAVQGNKLHHKIKADFKDVSIFDNFNNAPTPTPTPTAMPNTATAQGKAANPTQPANVPNPVQPNNSTNAAPDLASIGKVKKDLSFEVEYNLASEASAPSSPDEIPVNDIAGSGDMKLTAFKIKNFQISSPIYKVSVNGEISSFQKDGFPVGNISARVEKLDNFLMYFKKYITNINPIDQSNSQPASITSTNGATDVAKISDIKAPALSSDSATAPASNQKPAADISAVIKDLSKKNVASNDDIAVFDFRQEVGKDLVINETSLPEIMSQLFLSSINASAVNAASGGSSTIPSPTTITSPTSAATPTTATAPAVQKDSIKVVPANNNKANNASTPSPASAPVVVAPNVGNATPAANKANNAAH